jgi:5-methylcytosine-specific restriction protein A
MQSVDSSYSLISRNDSLPYKPRKPCSYPGCPELVASGTQYCKKHERAERKLYDKQRGTAAQRGYGSRWQRYRKSYLVEHPLCINFKECHNPAAVVDHIVPVSKGGAFWDPSNHQPMCEPCHDRKTAKEDGRWG